MKTSTLSHKRDLTNQLADFWIPHLIACEDLFTHLEYVDVSIKELRREALKRELQLFDAMLAKEVPKGWVFKEYRQRTIITLSGEITYLRRIYKEPSGICHAYLDEVLGIRTRYKLAPDAYLWIANMAADISFRKTVNAFYDRTGAKISPWLVMSVIHEEGALILEEAWQKAFGSLQAHKSDELLISQDVLYIEFDGICIPLQKSKHEKKKPRWVYEHNRKKKHFELKNATVYAGKDEKRRRGGVLNVSFGEHARCFWPLLGSAIKSVYDVADVSKVYSSSDMAGWCTNNEIDTLFAAADISHDIDSFHINREIRRTFGKTPAANHFISLVRSRRTKKLKRDLQRIIEDATDKKRYLKLQGYLLSNIKLIEGGHGRSMGSMEGVNAHVYAARMKVWGGAWSKKGACAMAAIRARKSSGLSLIAPKPDNVMYDDTRLRRRFEHECAQVEQKRWNVPESEGTGWEPPQGSIMLTTHMPSNLYGWLNYS